LPFRVVIPARFDSSRLPGKALLPLAGKPMLQWVHERARACGATEVVIATDDERIAIVSRAFGADVAMTARTHLSGTDRIAEVAVARGWGEGDIVVNVQGDEPLIPPGLAGSFNACMAATA
jgi:3-deoxy-manno-octulosonate cytidylyltransferase (CMP-KDO synthetase)